MTPAEIESLVEQVGDEILGRLGLPLCALEEAAVAPEAPADAWPKPQAGYAAAFELLYSAADATAEELRGACERARDAGVSVVWTPVGLTATTVATLGGSATRAGALIDFPHGGASTAARLADVETALRLGAEIVNLTLGAGRARSSAADVLEAEIRGAAGLCRGAGVPLAVTLEAALLSDDELARAAQAAIAGGADAVCGATGRNHHGFVSPRAITLLRAAVGEGAVVIGGGRIAGFGHAAALITAGADRIACEDPWAVLAQAPSR